MAKAGISEFLLNKEFIIKFNEGGMCPASFSRKTDSPSRISKRIAQVLRNRLEEAHKEAALHDIERQLIERHDEIFYINNNVDHVSIDEFEKSRAEYIEQVSQTRKQYLKSQITYEEWQGSVVDRYQKLKEITEKNFLNAWPLLQFCLAVKSILNIEGCTLPFMGVILAIPSSMKTLVIQLFKKYPSSFYSDNFTPNSFESHNAALNEDELRKVDLLPKLTSKLFLTPELAPIFTTNEDDLRKSFGIITRILDGHGLETDSGAQGHRKYGNTFFVWIGAAVEAPYRVWQLLGTLGHKLYFFRPVIPEKTLDELEKIAKDNSFQERFNGVENALLDYLIHFDAAPESSKIRIDENGIVKVKWDENKKNEEDRAIYSIAQIANLLKRLRGTVYISESKTSHKSHYKNYVNTNQNDENDNKHDLVPVDSSDYDTDYPIIEDPSRAVILLRNLALGHAISQGRDCINLDDMPLVINVALSSTTRARSELIRLLLDHNGQLTTSVIVKETQVSAPFAKRTMRELAALGIVDISAVAGYRNSELKIRLKDEYSWFKGQQFKDLLNRQSFGLSYRQLSNKNENHATELSQISNENENSARQSGPNTSDNEESQSHDETKATSRTHIQNIYEHNNLNEERNESTNNNNNNDHNNDSIQTSTEEFGDHIQSSSISSDSSMACDNLTELEEKNNAPLCAVDLIQHVTESYCHTETESAGKIKSNEEGEIKNRIVQLILNEIKAAYGSTVSIASVLESIYKEYEIVRVFIGDKLTQRENRKVRDLFVTIIRDEQIQVVKTKPQLLLRWIKTIDADDKHQSLT